MDNCVAINCKSKIGEALEKTFHRFPFWNPVFLEKWVSKLRRHPSWRPSPYSVLCSDHFEETCFDTIGNVKHIRADAVPTLFFTDVIPTSQNTDGTSEKPQIIHVVSLDNLFKSSVDEGVDPLGEFHKKIESFCKQKKAQDKKKLILQLLLSFKRFAVNQQKIKIVLNRQRLLRRKMMQSAMMMVLLTQQEMKINS